MLLRLTTNPGLEDIAAAEVRDLLGAGGVEAGPSEERAFGLDGVVTVEIGEGVDPDGIWQAVKSARSVYHVAVHIGRIEWRGQLLEDLAREIAALPLDLMATATGFRATCSRHGEHPFQSPDVERAVGGALQDRYGTRVDLETFDLNVRVDIVGATCLCGYQLSGRKGLDRRHRWIYHPRVTLRTPVAYAMLRLVGYTENPGNLLDPFCGSGTILLEAAPFGCGAFRTCASDLRHDAVQGCRKNLEAAGLETAPDGPFDVRKLDAHDLTRAHEPASFDYIVTNPPFGIRMGANVNFQAFYSHMLNQFDAVLKPRGVVSMLVGRRRGAFNRVLQAQESFRIEHVRVIEIGGVFPGLFVLRKVA